MALRFPSYTPNLNYGRTFSKIEDTISRKDLKAFKSLFLRFVVNLKEDFERHKNTEAIQGAYQKLDSYLEFFKREIMSTFTKRDAQESAVKLLVIGDIYQKFNNNKSAIAHCLHIVHFCMSKQVACKEFGEILGKTFEMMFVNCHWKEVIEEANKVIHYLSELNISKEEIHILCLYFKMKSAIKLNDYGKCLKFSRKLLKCYQSMPFTDFHQLADCYYRIADSHFYLGNSDLALRVMNEKVIPLTSQWRILEREDLLEDHADALFNIGRFHQFAKKADCFKAYQAFVDFLHEDAGVYAKLSRNTKTMMMEMQAKQFIGAYLIHGDNITILSDGKSEGDFNVARNRYEVEDYKGALKALDKCIDVPQFLMNQGCALELKGDCLFALEKYGEAVEIFCKTIKVYENETVPPPLCEIYQKLGLSYFKLEYWPESLDAYEKALDTVHISEFKKCETRVKKSMSLMELKKYQQALDVLKEAQNIIRNQGGEIASLQNLVSSKSAQALFHLGNFKAALTYLDLVLKSSETDEIKVLCMIYFVNCLRNLNEPQEIISKNFNHAFDLNAAVFKKKSSWHRSVLLLNQCIFHNDQKNKIAQNKVLDLLLKPKNLKLVTKALMNTPQETDIKPFFKLMRKRDKSEELENYTNSISILNHFKSNIH